VAEITEPDLDPYELTRAWALSDQSLVLAAVYTHADTYEPASVVWRYGGSSGMATWLAKPIDCHVAQIISGVTESECVLLSSEAEGSMTDQAA
jgi:hypothetical protein